MKAWFEHWFGTFFCGFEWYRRWSGGHWERWVIDIPVCSEIWMKFHECTKPTGARPPLGRCTPTCEDHPQV